MDLNNQAQSTQGNQPSPQDAGSLDALVVGAASIHKFERRVIEESGEHFTLRVSSCDGLVNAIELELKQNEEVLVSYTADGEQPRWLSEKLLKLLASKKGEITAQGLAGLWQEALSATHITWRVESSLGASHEALTYPRTPSIFPSVGEFAKNASLAANFFIAQKNEAGGSTAFVGRALTTENLALMVISRLSLHSSQPDIRCVTIPMYPGFFTKSGADGPSPEVILAELKRKLLDEGSQSFFAMLDSPEIGILETETSEMLKQQRQLAMQVYRTTAQPDFQWSGDGAITSISLHFGVESALMRAEVESCVGAILVSIGFKCGGVYDCLTATQLAFLISQGRRLAEGDHYTRMAVVETFTNARARALFLGSPESEKPCHSEEQLIALANLRYSAWSPDVFLPELLGHAVCQQLSTLPGITIAHQRLGAGLTLSEALQGIQAMEVKLAGKAKERNPEAWHSMRIALKPYGAWTLTAANGMGGKLDLHVGGEGMADSISFHEVAFDVLRAFSQQATLGEAEFRSELLKIEQAQANPQIPGLGALQVSDVPSLLDEAGLLTLRYAGRLLARLTGFNNRLAAVVGTYETTDVGVGCLSITSTASPYWIKFGFSNGTLSTLEFGTSVPNKPHNEAWTTLVRLQSLGFSLGSPEYRSLEDIVGRHLSQHQEKLRPDYATAAAEPLESPLIRDLLQQLERLFPQGIHREKGQRNYWIVKPHEPSESAR
jgi:hypothetical protein